MIESHGTSIANFDAMMRAAGLEKVESLTLGSEPLTLCNREVLPSSAGVRMHRAVQGLADRGFPVLRSAGSQYIALARKTSQA